MTIKELREYRLICSELEQIECHLNSSKSEISTVTLLERKSRLKAEKQRLETFLNRISDRKIKRAISLYCFDAIEYESPAPTWGDVAAKIGGGTTENSIKKSVERYLKENIYC